MEQTTVSGSKCPLIKLLSLGWIKYGIIINTTNAKKKKKKKKKKKTHTHKKPPKKQTLSP